MSALSTTYEKHIHGGMSIETTVYEDGYIHSILMDRFGIELGSLDGHERNGQSRGVIEDYLYDQYAN